MTPLVAYHRAQRHRRTRCRTLSNMVCDLVDLKPGQAAVVITARPIERLLAEAARWSPDADLRAQVKPSARPVSARTYVVERVA